MNPLLKFFGVPGSLPFLVCSLVVCWIAGRWFPRVRLASRVAIVTLLLGYFVLSLPIVANNIAADLSVVSHEVTTDRPLRLVVFDGDNRRGRARLALEIFRRQQVTGLWYLGEDWLLNELVAQGIPRDRISFEASHRTTRDQVDRVITLPQDSTVNTVVVVSRLQAARVTALFRAARFPVQVAPAPIDDEPPTAGVGRWVPRYIGLRVSRDAIYELAALRYYRYKGWIGPE